MELLANEVGQWQDLRQLSNLTSGLYLAKKPRESYLMHMVWVFECRGLYRGRDGSYPVLYWGGEGYSWVSNPLKAKMCLSYFDMVNYLKKNEYSRALYEKHNSSSVAQIEVSPEIYDHLARLGANAV